MPAAVLDCSHLLLIVALGIAHAMLATHCKARPTIDNTPAQSAPGEPYTGPPLGKDFGQFREQLSKVLLWWALSCTAASDGTVYGAHRPIVGASAIGTRIRVAQQILILRQEGDITPDCYAKQKQAKTTIIRQKSRHTAEATVGVLEEVPVDLRSMVELAAEKGASSWLTTLPIEEHGFYLNETAFWDAIYLRYGWKPERMPDKCVCSAQFSVEHALTCPRGGFTFIHTHPATVSPHQEHATTSMRRKRGGNMKRESVR